MAHTPLRPRSDTPPNAPSDTPPDAPPDAPASAATPASSTANASAGTSSSASTAPAPAPKERDVVLDVVRTGALAVVVLWHWVFTTYRWSDDGPHVGNPVAVTPGMWILTWVMQVMPAFFIVGGALHARSTAPAAEFWRARIIRLGKPVLPLLTLAAVLIALAQAAGRPDLVRAVILGISPMWFLAVYAICVLATPAARWAHSRFGWRVPLAGLAAVLVVDRLRLGSGIGGAATGAAAFVCVWLTVHQLGFHFSSLRAAPRRVQAAITVAGFSAMAIAATVGPYPLAMVGVQGERVSNMGPPTLMVVFTAVAQVGLLSLLAPAIARFGERHRDALKLAGDWSMTVYAWHLLAFAAFWGLLVLAGARDNYVIDAGWWLQRPIWFVGPALLAVPLCSIMSRLDPTTGRSRRTR